MTPFTRVFLCPLAGLPETKEVGLEAMDPLFDKWIRHTPLSERLSLGCVGANPEVAKGDMEMGRRGEEAKNMQ